MSSVPGSPSSNPSWFDRWIFDAFPVDAAGLGLYRIGVALFSLLILTPGYGGLQFDSVASLPDALYLPPPGPMQWVSGFPSPLVFDVLHGALYLSLTALLFGYRTRIASIATTLLLLIGSGWFFSAGKVNHTMLFVLLPLVMAFSNWGAAFSLDARLRNRSDTSPVASWPLTLAALLTGFAMFTAGLPKILGGWLDPSTQAVQSRVIDQFFVHERQDLLAPVALRLDAPWLWEMLDWATVLFEVGFLIAILYPLSTRLFAAGAVLFHTGVMLIMNIAFLPNLPIYAAFLPWSRIARALRPHVDALRPRLSMWSIGGLFCGTALFFGTVGSPLHWLDAAVPFQSGLTLMDVVGMGIALGVVVGMGIASLSRWLVRSRGTHVSREPPLVPRDTPREKSELNPH